MTLAFMEARAGYKRTNSTVQDDKHQLIGADNSTEINFHLNPLVQGQTLYVKILRLGWLYTSESDIYRDHISTYKDSPHTEKI